MIKNKIAIIGAGYIGLSAASLLRSKGYQVTIFEGSGSVGGLAKGISVDLESWTLEPFYHHWFKNEQSIIKLAKEHNLEHLIKTYNPRTTFFLDDVFIPLDSPHHTLTHPQLTFVEKLRLIYGLVIIKLSRGWKKFENITVKDWMVSNMGEGVYRKIWEPMMIGKWGKNHEHISMSWFWARIYTRTKALMYPDGGFQNFNEQFATSLLNQGVDIQLNSMVSKIHSSPDRESIKITVNNIQKEFDTILYTSSPGLLKKITSSLEINYSKLNLDQLEHCSAISYLFTSNKPVIENDYWVNIPSNNTEILENKIPFLVFVQHTNMIPPSHYNGNHVGYCGNYLSSNDIFYNKSDKEIEEIYIKGIQNLNPNFSSSDIIFSNVARAEYAQPIIKNNHSKLIPEFDIYKNKIFWASMNHVYPWDRGTNYAAEIGKRVALKIHHSIAGR